MTKELPAGVAAAPGYACTHCGNRTQLFRHPKSAARHVKTCIRNPAERTCVTCAKDWSEPGDHITPGGAGCSDGMRPQAVNFVRNCGAWASREAAE